MFTNVLVLFILGACFTNARKLTGGGYQVDPNDQEVTRLLQMGIDFENAVSNREPQKIVKVLNAVRQVVSGKIYTITYVSEGLKSGNRIQCEIKLHFRPWISDKPTYLGNNCHPVSTHNF